MPARSRASKPTSCSPSSEHPRHRERRWPTSVGRGHLWPLSPACPGQPDRRPLPPVIAAGARLVAGRRPAPRSLVARMPQRRRRTSDSPGMGAVGSSNGSARNYWYSVSTSARTRPSGPRSRRHSSGGAAASLAVRRQPRRTARREPRPPRHSLNLNRFEHEAASATAARSDGDLPPASRCCPKR